MSGFNGTIFADHLDKESPQQYKVGEKVNARIIAIDPQTQKIMLSLLPHIVKFQNMKKDLIQNGVSVGKIYETANIEKELYGGSFQVKLDKDVSGFLHKTHSKK